MPFIVAQKTIKNKKNLSPKNLETPMRAERVSAKTSHPKLDAAPTKVPSFPEKRRYTPFFGAAGIFSAPKFKNFAQKWKKPPKKITYAKNLFFGAEICGRVADP